MAVGCISLFGFGPGCSVVVLAPQSASNSVAAYSALLHRLPLLCRLAFVAVGYPFHPAARRNS